MWNRPRRSRDRGSRRDGGPAPAGRGPQAARRGGRGEKETDDDRGGMSERISDPTGAEAPDERLAGQALLRFLPNRQIGRPFTFSSFRGGRYVTPASRRRAGRPCLLRRRGHGSGHLRQDATAPVFAAKPNPSFQPFALTVSNYVENVDVSGTFMKSKGIPGVDSHFLFTSTRKGPASDKPRARGASRTTRLFDDDHVTSTGPTSFILSDFTHLIGQNRTATTSTCTCRRRSP